MKTSLKSIAIVTMASMVIQTAFGQQNRNLGEFTGIRAADAYEIIISQGDANTVKVDVPDNIQSKIKTEVKDGILTISTDGNLRGDKDATIYITTKNLTSIDITGSADVKTDKTITCDKLTIKSSGAGDVRLDLKANDIRAEISGAGDITLKGTAQHLDAEVSGAGDLKASTLETDKANIKVSGAGDAKVNVKQSLDADVSGAGSIIYKGNPTERNVNISGAGSVRESKSGNGEETASDTTKFKLGNKRYMIIGDNDDDKGRKHHHGSSKDSLRNYADNYNHWRGWQLGVNGMMDYNSTLNVAPGANFLELNYAKSYEFGLNFFEKDFHLYKNYINLVTGLGLSFNHYAFSNSMSLRTDSSSYLRGVKDSISYKKNVLNVSYLTIPLLLEINTSKNPKNNFHIAGGVQLGYRIHSVSKQMYDVDDHHTRIKQRDSFNLEPFKYDAVVRIGYNNVTVFANYGLNRLFQKDKGPQEYPFSVGVTIGI